jgi:hypothetical protein
MIDPLFDFDHPINSVSIFELFKGTSDRVCTIRADGLNHTSLFRCNYEIFLIYV